MGSITDMTTLPIREGDNESRVITTTCLPRYLAEWQAGVETLSDLERKAKGDAMKICLIEGRETCQDIHVRRRKRKSNAEI